MMKNKIILLGLVLAVVCEGQYQFSQQGYNIGAVQSLGNWQSAASPMSNHLGSYRLLSSAASPKPTVNLLGASYDMASQTAQNPIVDYTKPYYQPRPYLEKSKKEAGYMTNKMEDAYNNNNDDDEEEEDEDDDDNDDENNDDENNYDEDHDEDHDNNNYAGPYVKNSKPAAYSSSRMGNNNDDDHEYEHPRPYLSNSKTAAYSNSRMVNNNDDDDNNKNDDHEYERPKPYVRNSKTASYSNVRVEEARNEDIKIDTNKYESESYRSTYRAPTYERQENYEAYRPSYESNDAPEVDNDDDIITALQKFRSDILECIQNIDLKKYLKPKKSGHYYL